MWGPMDMVKNSLRSTFWNGIRLLDIGQKVSGRTGSKTMSEGENYTGESERSGLKAFKAPLAVHQLREVFKTGKSMPFMAWATVRQLRKKETTESGK